MELETPLNKNLGGIIATAVDESIDYLEENLVVDGFDPATVEGVGARGE